MQICLHDLAKASRRAFFFLRTTHGQSKCLPVIDDIWCILDDKMEIKLALDSSVVLTVLQRMLTVIIMQVGFVQIMKLLQFTRRAFQKTTKHQYTTESSPADFPLRIALVQLLARIRSEEGRQGIA
jgi:hypothetical protein